MTRETRFFRAAALVAAALAVMLHPAIAAAQTLQGVVASASATAASLPEEQSGLLMVAEAHDAKWMRLAFGAVRLPSNEHGEAFLRLTSLADGAEQRLTASHLKQWQHHSAYFNGSEVLVEVVFPPRVSGLASAELHSIETDTTTDDVAKSICGGTDDRTVSDHPAVGRIMPILCTAWITDTCNKCLATAGHCTSGSAAVAQFNVPMSLPDGTLVFPPPEDQYAIDAGQTLSTGLAEPGSEFGLIQVHPNPNTGLMPFEAQHVSLGFAASLPAVGGQLSVIGFGTDETLGSDPGEFNYVQRVHDGEVIEASDGLLSYQIDTTGGNSGSPVLDAQSGLVHALHTHGGCTQTAGNRGTSVMQQAFQDAMSSLEGPCVCPGLTIQPYVMPQDVVLPKHPIPITMRLVNPGIGSATVLADRAWIEYQIDNGPGGTIELTDLGGGFWVGSLPSLECGYVVSYSLHAETPSESVRWPADDRQDGWTVAGWRLFSFASFDFETAPRWTVESASNTEGEWAVGEPSGEPDRLTPIADADGSGSCWLTGPEAGNNDVDGGPTRVTTEYFEPAPGEAIIVEYARYFANDDGDDRFTAEARLGDADWSLIEDIGTDPLWRTIRRPVRSALGLQKAIQIRFSASDAPNNSITEAGVDALRVQSVSCQLSCAADLNGDGVVDFDDVYIFLLLFGAPWSDADINGDGRTDEQDLYLIMEVFLQECTVTPSAPGPGAEGGDAKSQPGLSTPVFGGS